MKPDSSKASMLLSVSFGAALILFASTAPAQEASSARNPVSHDHADSSNHQSVSFTDAQSFRVLGTL